MFSLAFQKTAIAADQRHQRYNGSQCPKYIKRFIVASEKILPLTIIC